MIVKNINGTSQNTCKCGSWLQHWKNFSNQQVPAYCPVVDCLERQLLGAHMQNDDPDDKRWFIVPLCSKHNAYAYSLVINDYIKLVSANVSETCGS
jgi:hypothetical protein